MIVEVWVTAIIVVAVVACALVALLWRPVSRRWRYEERAARVRAEQEANERAAREVAQREVADYCDGLHAAEAPTKGEEEETKLGDA